MIIDYEPRCTNLGVLNLKSGPTKISESRFHIHNTALAFRILHIHYITLQGSWERAGRGVRWGCDHRERGLSRHRLQHHGAGTTNKRSLDINTYQILLTILRTLKYGEWAMSIEHTVKYLSSYLLKSSICLSSPCRDGR